MPPKSGGPAASRRDSQADSAHPGLRSLLGRALRHSNSHGSTCAGRSAGGIRHPLPYPVRLGRNPIAIAMMVSTITPPGWQQRTSRPALAWLSLPDGGRVTEFAPYLEAPLHQTAWLAAGPRSRYRPVARLNRHNATTSAAFRGVASGFRLGTARLSLVVQSLGCIRTDKNTLPLPAALRTARSATSAILRTAFG